MSFQAIEANLRERLEELNKRLDAIKADASQQHSADFAESASERENDEVIDALGNETQAEILQIRRTLESIAAGTYGTCSSCGDGIAEQRLLAMPQATLCLRCASDAE